MKLIYIANARIPTEKAHGQAMLKMCEAFVRQEINLELVVPRRLNKINKDPFEYYSIKQTFHITKIPCIDLVGVVPKFGAWLQSLTFAMGVFLYFLFRKKNDSIIYGRDELSLLFLSFIKNNIYWEAHTAKNSFAVRRLLKKSKGIITISEGLKNFYLALGLPADKAIVLPSGVDLSVFEISDNQTQLRRKLRLPEKRKIIAYVGKYKTMGESKGVEDLIEAFSEVIKMQANACLMLVGLNHEEITEVEDLLEKKGIGQESYKLIPHVPPSEVPQYLKSADVLVMSYPNSTHYANYMSPLKLFEYMATGKPIVTTNLSTIRGILSNDSAVFVEPGNPGSLADGIVKVIENGDLSSRISKQALEDVKKFTWDNRARLAIEFIKTAN